jgi:hypothetical protein
MNLSGMPFLIHRLDDVGRGAAGPRHARPVQLFYVGQTDLLT